MTKRRYTITFDSDTAAILASLAKRENKSISYLANKLILEALDCRLEDKLLSAIAKMRDRNKLKTIAHCNAWK